jgi:hypothetical protein
VNALDVVFEHACKMGLEGIVSKRLGSRYRSGRTGDWLKKYPDAPAVQHEAEEDWGRQRWRFDAGVARCVAAGRLAASSIRPGPHPVLAPPSQSRSCCILCMM